MSEKDHFSTMIAAKYMIISSTGANYFIHSTRGGKLMKCDIPGYWTGAIVPESSPLRPRFMVDKKDLLCDSVAIHST